MSTVRLWNPETCSKNKTCQNIQTCEALKEQNNDEEEEEEKKKIIFSFVTELD